MSAPRIPVQVYARTAGFLYLIVIVCGVSAELFVRQRLVVPKDPAATANNILAHELLFRSGFAIDLAGLLCVMPLVLLLYEIFRVVNERVALLAVFFSLVGSAVQAVALVGHLAPLVFLKRGHDAGMSYASLQLQSIGYAVALAFFGGTMLARGYLIYRSTFFPRILGIFLALEGLAYFVNSFTQFLAPGTAASAVFAALMVFGLAEVALCLWLLFKGVDAAKWEETSDRRLSR